MHECVTNIQYLHPRLYQAGADKLQTVVKRIICVKIHQKQPIFWYIYTKQALVVCEMYIKYMKNKKDVFTIKD